MGRNETLILRPTDLKTVTNRLSHRLYGKRIEIASVEAVSRAQNALITALHCTALHSPAPACKSVTAIIKETWTTKHIRTFGI